MNYRNKRNNSGLSQYTIARELGIDYQKYLEVDRGERPLEGELISKFLDIIKRAKEIKINRLEKMKLVDEWLDSGKGLETCKEYGYTGAELARILGFTQGCMSMALNPENNFHKSSGKDVKEMIYDFLHNPINKKINKELGSTKVEEWYNENLSNLKQIILNNGYNLREFAELIGCSDAHLGNVINRKRNASMKLKQKIYDLLNKKDKIEEETKIVETTEEKSNVELYDYVEVSENPIDEPNVKIVEATEQEKTDFVKTCGLLCELEKLKEENFKLKRQIELYEKLIERL